jgi:predicted permease
MKTLHQFLNLFRRRKLDAEMTEEMRLHVELQTERNMAAGMKPDEARFAALRQFGNVASIQERAREVRHWVWLEQLGQDLRYSLRSLGKSPGYTGVVVLTLALGLGVNMALFTWFNAAAFRPLPVPQPEQLFAVSRLDGNGNESKAMTYPDFVAYREHQTVFSGLAAVDGVTVEPSDATEFTATAGEMPKRLFLEMVSANFFGVFAVPMTLGRPLISDDETSSGASPVIVLSHRFWQNYFGGDPAIIGRTLRLRGLTVETLTIVGVAGPEFHGTRPGAPAGWVPLLLRRGDAWRTDLKTANLRLTGRLRPGISREDATGQLQQIAREFLVRPDTTRAETIALTRASTYLNLTPRMLVQLLPIICLFGAVFLVSCANASNLMLARTVTRQFEFAVRSALGATRWRLFTQIMTENLVLGVLAGIAGWGVSVALLQFAWPWLLDMIPVAREGTAGLNLHADHRVFGFTLVVSMLAGTVGGFFPALQVTRRSVDSALKKEGSAFGRGIRVSRVRRVLAVGQLALSSALLFTAGLLVYRTLHIQFQDAGFDKSRLLTFEALTPRTYEPNQVDEVRRQALARIQALPGVAAVSEMPRYPFASSKTKVSVPIVGQGEGRVVDAVHLSVPADYYSTLQLPVIRGRTFAAGELAADRLVVISETAAKNFWPGEEALGRRLEIASDILVEAETAARVPANDADRPRTSVTVVGVVGDSLVYDPWSGARPVIYLPLPPQARAAPYLLIRMNGEARLGVGLFQQVGRAVTGVVPRVTPVEELFHEAFVQYRVMAWLAGILAVISLIVAVIGLHGVMSFAVNQRVREIGIRIALGATPKRVVSGIVFESLCLVGAGAVGGYGLSVGIAVIARNILQGLNAFNPLVGVAVTLLLAAVGLLACWMPARRAAKVDPMVALRAE